MNELKVAVICEFSGIVRNAFTEAGHDATSFDLLPTEIPGKHIKGDILDIPYEYWQQFDLAICHPPCTDLSVAGACWFYKKNQDKALNFVKYLMSLQIKRICIENPVSVISTKIFKPTQIIQPYYFGHQEQKRTCLWLKNLPLLVPTNIVNPGESIQYDNGKKMSVWYAKSWNYPVNERWKIRSKTFIGIAAAMAEQWGDIKEEQMVLF